MTLQRLLQTGVLLGSLSLFVECRPSKSPRALVEERCGTPRKLARKEWGALAQRERNLCETLNFIQDFCGETVTLSIGEGKTKISVQFLHGGETFTFDSNGNSLGSSFWDAHCPIGLGGSGYEDGPCRAGTDVPIVGGRDCHYCGANVLQHPLCDQAG